MAKAKGSKAKKVKKRNVKVEPEGYVYIQASFNNIIISLTNKQGQVISWASAGKAGFRGSKKNTPYAAQIAASDAAKTAATMIVSRTNDKMLKRAHNSNRSVNSPTQKTIN